MLKEFIRDLFSDLVDGHMDELYSNGQTLSVTARIRYNKERDEFIVVYGAFEKRMTSIGFGSSISEAFIDLSNHISEPNLLIRKQDRERWYDGIETNLSYVVLHNSVTSEYIVKLFADDTEIAEGDGRNMSLATKQLGRNLENVNLELVD